MVRDHTTGGLAQLRQAPMITADDFHRTVGQHELDCFDVIGRRAVDRSVSTRRVVGDHAAEGRPRSRRDIGAETQTVRCELGVELVEHHPGADPHGPFCDIEIADAPVVARILMSPLSAKLFQHALSENLTKYEATFGEIVIPKKQSLADDLFRSLQPPEAPEE